jgi:membrane AbrB-like protein
VALGRRRDGGPVTGSLALTAGGASGLVSMAGELGADQRLVAVVQYLRVLLVTATLPVVLLVTGARGDGTARAAAPLDAPAPWWVGLLLVVVVGTAGSVLGRLARLPAGALLGPLVLAALVGAAGLSRGAEVPVPLVDVAYAVIGLQAGLSATRESLRVLRRALPAALLLTVAVLVACAGLGVALSAATGVSLLDGYLATTPGGLWAVLAASLSVGSDVTFVLAVQVMRLLVVLLTAPLLSRLLRRYAARSTAGPTPGPAAPARPRRRPRGRRRRRGAPG